MMNSSLKLFSVRDIDVRLHITFPLILVWAAIQFGLLAGNLSSALFGVVAVSLLFVLVTLHELGHSFAAQYYGVTVKQIVLSPLGGVAQLKRIPEKPVQELVIAVAGPAVNVLIALIMALLLLGSPLDLANPLIVLSGQATIGFTTLFTYVFIYNIILAVFNLIPAFPLDGGRIFRALLAMKLDYAKATSIAANVGRVVAILLGIYGLLSGGFFLALIALFIFMAGTQEARYVALRSRLRGYTVQQVYNPSARKLNHYSTVQQASNLMILSGQGNFPVVYEGRLLGFITRRDLVDAMRTSAPHSFVTNIMRKDVVPVSPHDDLYDVRERMQQEQMEALPVVNGSEYLGMIGQGNIDHLYRVSSAAPNVVIQKQSA